MIPLDDPTTLSLLFHLNSEPWLNDEAYRGGGPYEVMGELDDALADISLPQPPATPLDDLFRRRRSCRSYLPGTMSLPQLASLVRGGYGEVGADRNAPVSAPPLRVVPSAGGLYPLDLYAYVRRIDGLDDGLYRYDPLTHTLQLLRLGDLFDSLQEMLYAYPFVQQANVVLALAATFARTQAKYGPRGYRYILLEAGHVGQNVCLRAAELGLSALCIGGFIDSEINAALDLDPRHAGVVYMLGIGHGAEAQVENVVATPADQRGG